MTATSVEEGAVHPPPTASGAWKRSAAASAVVVIASVIWHRYLGLGTDPSWGLTMSERLLDGERLYVDIMHTNPPLNAWLNVPVVAFARSTGLSPELVLYLRGYLVMAFGTLFAVYALAHSELPERAQLPALVPATLFLLLIQVGNEFGQREHLGVALFLPLVVISARRANGERPPTWLTAAAGVCGAFLVLLKPHFAIVVVALALASVARTRSIRSLVVTENVVAAVMLAAYLGWTWIAFPAFYSDLLPLMEETYLQQTDRLDSLVLVAALLLAWAIVMWLTRTGRPFTPLVTALAVGGIASTVPMIVQGKNWPYHGYPAVVLALLAAISWALPAPTATVSPRRASPFSGRVRAVTVALLVLTCLLPFRFPNGADDSLVATLTDPALVHAERPSLMTLAPGPETGFPLTRQIGATFPSRWAHDWHGAGALYFSRAAPGGPDRERARHYLALAEEYRAERLDELERHRPDILIVDQVSPFWYQFVAADPRFDTFIEDYALVWSGEESAAFVRNGSAN